MNWKCFQSSWPAILMALLMVWTRIDSIQAAEEGEGDQAFIGVVRVFEGGWYDQAEKGFADYLIAFPQSTNRSEALLLEAECRFHQKNYQGVIALLQDQIKAAGPWADQYLYWLAEAQSEQSRFDLALKSYQALLRGFPNSPLRLQSSYGEAFAHFKLGDTVATVEVLKNSTNAFQQAAKFSTNEVVLVRGSFLLAEALFAQRDFHAAEQALTEVAQRGLSREFEWQRQYLLTRIEMADRRPNEALLRVANLVTNSRSNVLLQAKSLSLKAEILEGGQPEAAAQTYDEITKLPGIPLEQHRQSLLKLVELAVAQDRLTNAIERLKSYLSQNPREAASDLMLMTLGEIYLKQFYLIFPHPAGESPPTVSTVATNLLISARAQFDQVLNQFTNSPYLGKAQLNRGWCYWEESQLLKDPARLVEAEKALSAAMRLLPKSFDHATACFKLGDCHFQLKDYPNALTNYQLVLDKYSDLAEAREKLLDKTLSQIVHTSIQAKDLKGAAGALDRLLREFPNSRWSEDALLYYARALVDAEEFVRARAAFVEFEKRFPNSPLLPEASLESARVYARQGDWPQAIQRYNDWITKYNSDTNEVHRAQAAFDRAWCYYQSGSETNAFRGFTNVLQQFPTSSYASLARLWIGDYYLNQRDYEKAEINYFVVSTNQPSQLTEHARIMAAKAAFFGQLYNNARNYLTNLVNGPHTDPEVKDEAYFMLGDIEIEDPSSTNKLEKFEQAINRFRIVSRSTNALAPLALGKIANCHWQLGDLDTNRYDQATNFYWKVIQHPLSDSATRNQAEFGLGQVLEQMAKQRTNRTELLNEALAHYLEVIYSKNPDPFWLVKAASAAGTLAVDRLHQFDQAEKLYREMIKTVPSMKVDWEARLESLQQLRGK